MAKTWNSSQSPHNRRKWLLVTLAILLAAFFLTRNTPRTYTYTDTTTNQQIYSIKVPLRYPVSMPKTQKDRKSARDNWYPAEIKKFGTDNLAIFTDVPFMNIRSVSPRDCDYASSPEDLQSKIDAAYQESLQRRPIDSCFSPYPAPPKVSTVGSHTLYAYAGGWDGTLPSNSYVFSNGKLLMISFAASRSELALPIIESLQF